MLVHCRGLLGRLTGTKPSLGLLATPVLFLLWQVKTSASNVCSMYHDIKEETEVKMYAMQRAKYGDSVCMFVFQQL